MFVLWVSGVRAQREVLMMIDGKEVTYAEYEDFCLRKGVSTQAIDFFIDYKLKVNAARRLCLDTLSSFRNFMDSCRHSLSENLLIGGKEVAADYIVLKKIPHRVLVSHIFQYIPQNATARMLLTCQARMDSLYSFVISGENSFEELVRKYSQEKESFWVDETEMPAEFRRVVFTLSEGDVCVSGNGIHQGESLIVITENGIGKRLSSKQFNVKGRGGLGQIYIKLDNKTGSVVSVKTVGDKDDIMVVTTDDMTIKVKADSIPELGRNAKGVKIVNIHDDAKVSDLAVVPFSAEEKK